MCIDKWGGGLFYIDLTHSRVTGKRELISEKMLPKDWSVSKPGVYFS